MYLQSFGTKPVKYESILIVMVTVPLGMGVSNGYPPKFYNLGVSQGVSLLAALTRFIITNTETSTSFLMQIPSHQTPGSPHHLAMSSRGRECGTIFADLALSQDWPGWLVGKILSQSGGTSSIALIRFWVDLLISPPPGGIPLPGLKKAVLGPWCPFISTVQLAFMEQQVWL